MRYFVSILVLQSSLLCLSTWCLVIVVWLFLAAPWVCLQVAIVVVVLPDHTHFFAIKGKRWGKLAAGILLLHVKVNVRRSRVAQVAIYERKFEQINHPSYSLDQAQSDYYLFRNLKSNLRGR